MKTKLKDTIPGIIFRNVFTYFNLIFAILAALLIIAGSYKSLTFLPVVIANAVIGIVQQIRAKRILDKLTLISEAVYEVNRDGEMLSVPSGELKTGDIITLESGQQIPADAEVTDGKISANESLLTGESDEIEKVPGISLMSGSFVVSGTCHARLTKTGEDSYISQLSQKAKEIKEKPSEMVGDIDKIVKIAGIAIIPIGILLMYQGMVTNGQDFKTAVVSMVGAVIGMIPEGLYLLVTVALALSAARLAQKSVLLHDMRSTETLARVDVLCVDKTGTITTNEMRVTKAFLPAGHHDSELTGAKELLSSYVATTTDNNITSRALRDYFPDGKAMDDPSDGADTEIDVRPFSSKLKYSEIATDKGTYRFGAPGFILSEQCMDENQSIIREYTAKGERVLVLAAEYEEGKGFEPIIFVSLENGLRENVKETFKYLDEQEVRVMVISGDDPVTVSSIADTVEIANADKYVDASTLDTEEKIRAAVSKYTVFGRVKPEQKKQIVEALKAEGLRVAMTGDGVNDILAMKEADCSIAMGAGSDAAMQAAQVVLLDSDFSHMEEIIGEGRRDINNLTRSATLFLYKNIFSMLLAIFSIINAFTYPLQPSQISLVSTFNIGIPAFLLALEANERKQHGRFIKVTLLKSLPAALTSFFAIAALVVFGKVFSITESDVGVASTFLLSFVGFMILWRICRPRNRYRNAVIGLCIAGFAACAWFASRLFSIDYISYQCVMLAAVFAIAQESLMRNITEVVEDKFEEAKYGY